MSATSSHITEEELMALADGELPPSEAVAAEAHLQECADCAARLSAWRREAEPLEETLASWTAGPVPMRIERVVLGALATRRGLFFRLAQLHAGAGWLSWEALAAGLMAVAVLIGVIAVHQTPRPLMAYTEHEMLSTPPVFDRRAEQGMQADRSRAPQPEGVDGMSGGVVGGVAGRMPNSFQQAAPPPPSPLAEMKAARQAAPRAGGGAARDFTARTTIASVPTIARTASLNITVDNVDRERVVLEGLLGRYGGYAAQMQVNTPANGPRSLTASLRVPAPMLAQAVTDLRTLGHVESESQSGEDVSQDHADLEARLTTARSTEDRLRGILREHTGSVSDVLEVEEEIASTREKIESMEAELDGMEHRVRYATVDLQLSEMGARPRARTVGGRLGQSLATGWNNAEELLVSLVLWLAEEGPAIAVVLLLLGVPVVFLWRRYRRTRLRR